jgi:hypothetical protein
MGTRSHHTAQEGDAFCLLVMVFLLLFGEVRRSEKDRRTKSGVVSVHDVYFKDKLNTKIQKQ